MLSTKPNSSSSSYEQTQINLNFKQSFCLIFSKLISISVKSGGRRNFFLVLYRLNQIINLSDSLFLQNIDNKQLVRRHALALLIKILSSSHQVAAVFLQIRWMVLEDLSKGHIKKIG